MGCFGNRSLVPGADRVFVLAAGRTAESSDPHWTDTRSTAGTARGLIMLFVVFPLLCRAYAAPARAVAVACRDALSLTAMLQCHCPRQIRKKPMHVRTHDARRTTHDSRRTTHEACTPARACIYTHDRCTHADPRWYIPGADHGHLEERCRAFRSARTEA